MTHKVGGRWTGSDIVLDGNVISSKDRGGWRPVGGRWAELKPISEKDSDANMRGTVGGAVVGPQTTGSRLTGSTTEAPPSQENISQQPPLFSLSLAAFHQSLQTGAEPPPPPPLKLLRLVYLYMNS